MKVWLHKKKVEVLEEKLSVLTTEKLFTVLWKAAWLKLQLQREKVTCLLVRGEISWLAAKWGLRR